MTQRKNWHMKRDAEIDLGSHKPKNAWSWQKLGKDERVFFPRDLRENMTPLIS